MTSVTIFEFMLARIAEDEGTARVHKGLFELDPPLPDDLLKNLVPPEKIRVEAAAKRSILRLHADQVTTVVAKHQGEPRLRCRSCNEPMPCRTLLAMVSVHIDHPDFDFDWLPTDKA